MDALRLKHVAFHTRKACDHEPQGPCDLAGFSGPLPFGQPVVSFLFT